MQKSQEYRTKVQNNFNEIENIKIRIAKNINKNENEKNRIFKENMKEYKEYFKTIIDPSLVAKSMEYHNSTENVGIMKFNNKYGLFRSFIEKVFTCFEENKNELLLNKALNISKDFYEYVSDGGIKNCEIAKELYEELFPSKVMFECNEYIFKGEMILFASVIDEKDIDEDIEKHIEKHIEKDIEKHIEKHIHQKEENIQRNSTKVNWLAKKFFLGLEK